VAVLLPTRNFNFITNCYFMTLRALHIGLLRVIMRYGPLVRDLSNSRGVRRITSSLSRPGVLILKILLCVYWFLSSMIVF
jgi:hypothetical protein